MADLYTGPATAAQSAHDSGLPLLRYRTGDWASPVFRDDAPVLISLEGRQPVMFRGAHSARSARGQRINNIDVSTVLKPFALAQVALRQNADGSLRRRVRGTVADPAQLHEAILSLFGAGQALAIEEMETLTDKVVQYSSDLQDDSRYQQSPRLIVVTWRRTSL